MANIQQAINDEVRRLARKEIKNTVTPLKQQLSTLRQNLQAAKAEIKNLQTQLANRNRPVSPVAKAAEETSTKVRKVSPEGIAKIRTRLGISQVDFAGLLGVGALSVSSWENGRSHPRHKVLLRIAALRNLNKHELKRLLEAMHDAQGKAK